MNDKPLFEIRQGATPMLVHTPHAGRLVPDGFDRTRLTDPAMFDQTCEQVRDRHADTLGLMIAARLDATIMLDHTTRMWCDPERYPDDREEMNKAGMGVIPTRDIDGHPLYKPGQAPGMRERGQRFRLLYTPWHRMLQAQCRTMLDTYGRCTIIDVHTHPREPRPFEPHADQPRAQTIIGHNNDPASRAIGARAAALLMGRGLTVGVNTAHRGAITPDGIHDIRLASIMVETRWDTAADPRARHDIADAIARALEGRA